jgi:hypothetical protein
MFNVFQKNVTSLNYSPFRQGRLVLKKVQRTEIFVENYCQKVIKLRCSATLNYSKRFNVAVRRTLKQIKICHFL